MDLPKHIAIIMDGNGRWAKKKGLGRIFGHRAGIESVRDIIRAANEIGISVLTLFAFSTENWNRPESEIRELFGILKYFLKKELNEIKKNGIVLRILGNISGLPSDVRSEVARAENDTRNNTGMILNVALNYGGRQEIIQAVNRIVSSGVKSVDETEFERYLYTGAIPSPDLLIRTSGEYRISNFLLWQIAYTELYFTDVLWPDFRKEHLLEAIAEYQKRERRFGGL
ncbi:MAG: Ditrans,polycis-undecaprenyl-diphosphate synthase ((2E,6E)-farnesyl-diphosphate specific) [Elusimicrobia bacterium ADurb.Bin231]|nr:MAG: Ditrans,polycis-undecaprenyl-diphosphate synthase ((2E,6E)-farnesyl-diphosphate specific) [Elusimicrobia bacterium ADurb.Bin231]